MCRIPPLTATLNVALAMANGNQIIAAEKYKTITITKPDTIVPENIKKGELVISMNNA